MEEANALALKLSKVDLQVSILLFRAIISRDSNLSQSEDLRRQAKDLAVSGESPLAMAKVLEQYALNYYHDQQFERAYDFFLQSLEQYTQAGHFHMLPELHYNLACVASHLSLPDEVIKNLTEAIHANPKFRKLAQTDEDFRGFHSHEIFAKLIADE